MAGCFRAPPLVDLPIEQIEARAQDANALGEDIRLALEEVEFEMYEAFSDIPEDAFDERGILLVRYALLSCFTDPLCQPGDERPICVRRNQDFDPSAAMAVQLDERPPMYGYRACEIPASTNFVESVPMWAPEGLEWFRRRVVLIDSLRVRLKAIIPARLEELDARMMNYDTDLRLLNNRAEDAWRDAQRVERRAEQRRRDEEQWDRFQQQMIQLQESLTLIRLDVERLRDHQRRDVRDVAVRIATLGAAEF